jgi:hypothetical protein
LTVFPARIRWSATTTLPPAQVKKVYFLVDGDRWWADSLPPYTYGPAGAYLPASWVSSLPIPATGRRSRTHQFAIRVDTTNGERWEGKPVRAQMPRATYAAPPGFGKFGRSYHRLSSAEIANPPPPGTFGRSRGYLFFRGSALFVSSARGEHHFAWQFSSDRKHVHLGTPIFLAEQSHADNNTGFNGVDEALCAPDGPPATYEWSSARGRVTFSYNGYDEYAHNLTLHAVNDPCKERRRLLEGVWEGIPPD